MLDAFVDYEKTEKALMLEQQKIVVKGRPAMRQTTIGWQIC